ncbi:MAG: tRNA (adenosine(37)-N6)-threonylcarbamoyltransferase complex dimerization subunit type 1 TsaB [Cytophagia bacterium]|nr:tRNA (adenosine(37)-N6)-threonylcarbamoyltransferase complex dimerization subunit type 1 TsaB [Cytophagia bacterium]
MKPSTSPLLLLDHASPVASVAVVDGEGKVLASSLELRPQMQAERLALMVQACLKDAGLRPAQLGAIACQRGPGSYTGLRIGAALAQGIALPWNIPILGVSTLEAMAWGWWHQDSSLSSRCSTVISMMDARRMEVFCGVYGWTSGTLEVLASGSALVLDQDAFSAWAGHRVALVGDGVAKWRNLLVESQQIERWQEAIFVSDWQCNAASWAGLALRGLALGQTNSPADFRVDYHKDFYSPSLQGR